ncbi:MAG: type II secretion system F family protein [Pirellula sp.]|jgi:tight adherence protein C
MNQLISFAFLDRNILILGAVFLGVGTLVWFLIDFFSSDEKRAVAEDRLDRLNDLKRKNAESADSTGRFDRFTNALEQASPSLSKYLEPKTVVERNKLAQRLSEAGYRNETSSALFLSMKVIAGITGFILGGGLSTILLGFNSGVLLKALLGGGILFFLPEFILDYLAKKRRQAITLALPDCLDLLVVSVEAGLGLDQAMRKVSEEMASSYPILTEEIQLCTLHLQMGKVRSEVLQDLGNRTGVEDLRTLASLLIQADKFGSGVAQALRVQSDSMRIKRQQIAEEKAAKTAVKLIFPLVIFIFPGVFVVLVGPAAIQMAREMLPAMSGQ